ncbi:MAG: hypothetical protein IJV72_00920 [Clostridia bacterium]|nr:hypothetical protein [Clostridia bacterium]
MNADIRIQWLHKKLCENCYPNAMRLSEKFNISHRQAQRDIEHLRKNLGAPLKYSNAHKGFYYDGEFSLPMLVMTENDSEYVDVVSGVDFFDKGFADRSVIQMQIPYNALLEIKDRLTVMNMRPFIVGQRPKHVYECEFQSVEMFLGAIIAMDSDIKILSPDWLLDRLVSSAERVLKNNKK